MTRAPERNEHGRAGRASVAPGRDRWPDGGRGRAAEGDGLRDGGGIARCSRPVHRPRPDGDLRAARHVARAERQFDDHAGDTGRHAARPGRAGRRPGQADSRNRHVERAGRRDAAAGAAAAPRIRRQLHLHTGADRLQGRHRTRDRAGPGAEAVRPAHREARLLSRRPERRASAARDLVDHVGRGRGDIRRPDRHGADEAALPGTPHSGRWGHRSLVVLRPEGAGSLDSRPDSARLPGADAAGSSADRRAGPGRTRNRPDELHGDDCCRACLCTTDRRSDQSEPRAGGHRGCQCRGRVARRDACRWRNLADSGGAHRGRPVAEGIAGNCSSRTGHHAVSRADPRPLCPTPRWPQSSSFTRSA